MKKYILIAFVFGIAVGFMLNKEGYKVVVKEIKGDAIKEVVQIPSPSIQEANFNLSKLPYYVFKEIVRVDTITQVAKVDTLAILRDYTALKKYSYILFNNEYGKLTLDQNTQYNSILSTSYHYEPIKRIESFQKKWQILLGAGYSSNNYIGPTVGVIYKDFGVIGGYRYNFNNKDKIIDISVMYRL